jgi:monofunctional biosynthetic peptidoglycan transglycosylase
MIQSYLHSVRSGQELAPVISYTWVTYEAISPQLALAVIAAEDQKFPQHKGFDVAAIRSALQESAQGKRLRGASTISQQVSKNLFLWSGRSFLRKGLEAWFTLLIEVFWPKQRILEVYLNIIELGELTFGVEAASQRFFSKSALQVNRQEAALLAAVLPNPKLYRVSVPSQYVRKRQAWILEQMRRLGDIAYLENL